MNQPLTSPQLIDTTITALLNGRTPHLLTTANLTTPPTHAELTAQLGAADEAAGQIAILDNNAADTHTYLILSNGQSWHYLQFTKAT